VSISAEPVNDFLARHAGAPVCYLETIGRVTRARRTIEIWFASDGRLIYMLAGGRERAHWVRNLRRQPRVRVRLAGRTFTGTARVVEGEPEEATARRMLAAKYQGWQEGRPLSGWARGALPVAIEVDSAAA
jgi:deazaflavin-dependent oxidoreductase (nitroreductase family)